MKKLLNTLYVTTQGAYLAKEGETVTVRHDKSVKLRVPIHTLSSIVCLGRVSCSPALMGLCGQRNVHISFLTERGRFFARVHGAVSGNVLLRRQQYRFADDENFSATLARDIILAKIANSRVVLMRAVREGQSSDGLPDLEKTVERLSFLIENLKQAAPLEFVRGREGESSRAYFSVFDHLITAQKEDFFFRGRSRRPPLDRMNALLSFLYTLLAHDVGAALEGIGLDPAVGFLHRDRPGRQGLALDLMEEFRAFLADRLALTLVNRQQVRGKGFRTTESGAILMDDATRKEVLVAYQKRKQEEIQHPFLGERVAIGLLPHVQAMLLARYIRGDTDGYPPFFWR